MSGPIRRGSALKRATCLGAKMARRFYSPACSLCIARGVAMFGRLDRHYTTMYGQGHLGSTDVHNGMSVTECGPERRCLASANLCVQPHSGIFLNPIRQSHDGTESRVVDN